MGLEMTRADEEGQKHTLARDEETKGALRTQMGEDKSTHLLEMRRQKGV